MMSVLKSAHQTMVASGFGLTGISFLVCLIDRVRSIKLSGWVRFQGYLNPRSSRSSRCGFGANSNLASWFWPNSQRSAQLACNQADFVQLAWSLPCPRLSVGNSYLTPHFLAHYWGALGTLELPLNVGLDVSSDLSVSAECFLGGIGLNAVDHKEHANS